VLFHWFRGNQSAEKKNTSGNAKGSSYMKQFSKKEKLKNNILPKFSTLLALPFLPGRW
jgi:hypothetical protein